MYDDFDLKIELTDNQAQKNNSIWCNIIKK